MNVVLCPPMPRPATPLPRLKPSALAVCLGWIADEGRCGCRWLCAGRPAGGWEDGLNAVVFSTWKSRICRIQRRCQVKLLRQLAHQKPEPSCSCRRRDLLGSGLVA